MAKFLSEDGVTHLVEKLDSRYLKTDGSNSMEAGAGIKFKDDFVKESTLDENFPFQSGLKIAAFTGDNHEGLIYSYGSLLSVLPQKAYGFQIYSPVGGGSGGPMFRSNGHYGQLSWSEWRTIAFKDDLPEIDTALSTSEIDYCLSSVVFPG